MPASFSTPSESSAPAFSEILKHQPPRNQTAKTGIAAEVNQAFERLILQTGSVRTHQQWLTACVCMAALCAAAAFAATSHLLITAAAVVFGATIPLTVASTIRRFRQRNIVQQLPAAAESISKNCIAGHNLESALQQTAKQTASPLGDELHQAVRKIGLGITPADAIGELQHRTGVMELAMFCSAIKMHQNHGGNIAIMLERFAASVRDRLHFDNRMRAATIATRLGTTLMLGLPPCIVAYYSYQDSGYLSRLLSSSIGRLSVTIAVTLQLVGAISVYRILKQSSRHSNTSR